MNPFIYLLFNISLIFFFGIQGLSLFGDSGNFWVSLLLMLAYSWVVQRYFFKLFKHNLYHILLFGLVLTLVISTFTQFIQLNINPSEFIVSQQISYTSFNRSTTNLLIYCSIIQIGILIFVYRQINVLNILALGREQSRSLGINYEQKTKIFLAVVAIMVAISTSLVGPSGFMGIFVANIAYAITKTTKHQITLISASLLSICLFLVAQLLVEQVFNYRTTVSILINLLCGSYFMLVMIKRKREI